MFAIDTWVALAGVFVQRAGDFLPTLIATARHVVVV
jgi:hypothetical protein